MKFIFALITLISINMLAFAGDDLEVTCSKDGYEKSYLLTTSITNKGALVFEGSKAYEISRINVMAVSGRLNTYLLEAIYLKADEEYFAVVFTNETLKRHHGWLEDLEGRSHCYLNDAAIEYIFYRINHLPLHL